MVTITLAFLSGAVARP